MTKYILPLFMFPLLVQAETVHFKGTESMRVGGNPPGIVPKVVFVELGADEKGGTLKQRILRVGPSGEKVMFETQVEAKKKSGDDWALQGPNGDELPGKVKFKSGQLESLVATTESKGAKVIITTERPGEKDFANSVSVVNPQGKEVYSSLVKGNLISKAEFDTALDGHKIEKYEIQKEFAKIAKDAKDMKDGKKPEKSKGKSKKSEGKKSAKADAKAEEKPAAAATETKADAKPDAEKK